MIFNYSGSGSIRPGVNKYSTTFDQTVGYKFDVSISATASISSFDKTSQSLDFSNSKNNSSASFPTTFDAGYKLPVTFDTQDQIITNIGNKSVTYSTSGSGSVTFSGTCVEKFAPNPLENVELFNISGSKVESIRDSYVGVGTITISAAQVEKNTESYVGSGSIIPGRSYLPAQTFDETSSSFDLNGNTLPVVAPTFDKNYINFAKFNVDTLSPLTFDNGLINQYGFSASKTQSIPNHALEKFVTNPPEDLVLFNISGSYNNLQAVNSWRGSGSIAISGTNSDFKLTDSYFGSGPITLSSAKVEKNTESYVGSGPIVPGRSYLPPTSQTFDQNSPLFDLDSNKLPVVATTFDKDYINFAKFNVATLTPLTFDNGLLNPYAFGATQTQSIPNHALESFVVNPPEDLVLFNISGAYNNLQAVNSWRGSGSIIVSGTPLVHPQVDLTPHYGIEQNIGIGTYAFTVSGSAKESFIAQTPENNQLFSIGVRKLPAVGFGGNPELYTTFDKDNFLFQQYQRPSIIPPRFDSAVVNPGVLGTDQFIFNTGNESISYARYTGSTVTLNISAAYNNLQAVNSWRGSGSIAISGTPLVHPQVDLTPHYGIEQNIGIGTYAFTVSGSAKESFIAQTPENNQLFRIGVSKIPPVPVLQTFDQTQSVFDIDGNKLPTYVSFDKDYLNFAKFNVATVSPLTFDNTLRNPASVDAQVQYIPNHALESFIANPPEDLVLFNISGSKVERIVDSYVGSGSATFSGAYTNLKATDSYFGSGSIIISASQVEKNTESYVGSGSIIISASQVEKNTESYVGSGSVTFSGTCVEKFAPNPLENVELFNISGSKVESIRDSYVGVGTITISAAQVEKNTESYVGSGSIISGRSYLPLIKQTFDQTGPLFDLDSNKIPVVAPTFDKNYINFAKFNVATLTPLTFDNGLISPYAFGATQTQSIPNHALESFIANPPEDLVLFNINGTCVEKFAPNPPENVELFNISGSCTIKSTDVYLGSGFGSATFSGAYTNLKATDSYFGSGSATFSGAYTNLKFRDSYVGSGSIVISAAQVEKVRDSYVGSGSVTFSGTCVEKFAPNPLENVELFNISGSATQKFGKGLYTATGSIISGRSYLPPIERTFDQTYPLFDIDSNKIPVVAPTFDKNYINFAKFNVATLTPLTFDNGLISPYAFGATQTQSIPNYALVSATINNPTSGVITISAAEILRSTNSYVGVGTIIITGTVGQVYGPNPPENTELFVISGSKLEGKSKSYVGSGSATFSGAYTNLKFRDSYVGSGSITLYSAKVEKVRDSYVGVGTIRISGNLNESYTKRGYQGSGGVIFSASKAESKTNAVEASTITPIRLRGELIFPQVRYIPSIPSVGVITAYGDILKVRATVVERGSGSLRLNDDAGLTVTTPVLPVSSRGGIFVGGNGKQSFSRSTYVGIGVARFSGISKTRTFAVYTGIGSGQITVSQQTKVIGKKLTKSYRGTGSITLYSAKVEKNTESYNGLGRVNVSGTAINKFAPNPPENAQLFNLYGRGAEAFVKSKYIGIGTATFSSTLVERKSKSYSGSGSVGISGTFSIVTTRTFQSIGNGLLRFKKYVSDDIYGTCDSLDITCDYQDTGYVKFISNPPESIQIFTVYGSANTRKSSRYTYSGSGRITISGSVATKKSKSISGSGNVVFSSRSTNKDVHAYKAIGSIAVLSGSAKSLTKKPISSTVLYTVSGIASTKINHIIRVSGIGTGYFNGSANTKVLSRPSYSGTGSITLSGQLVHPNIKFLPRPKGSGRISIVGSADKKFVHKYTRTSGTLFAFSGGRESYGRKGYIGIGTIRVQSTIGITVNNPYQIPRTYVWII